MEDGERRLSMLHKGSKILSTGFGVILLVLVVVMTFIYWGENHPISVEKLWQKENGPGKLEGKILTVSGDRICDPLSDFRFNSLYLVDSKTSNAYRDPAYGFWFGIRIDGVSCTIDTGAETVTCEPFNPCQATAFEFKGTIHLGQVGKKEIIWLSDIKFDQARQFVNGKWQPIPLGKFTFPLKKDEPD